MQGLTDIHCHIVPGVDDGARSPEMSLQLLQQEADAGVSRIICTPHYRRGMFEPDAETVQARFSELQEAAAGRFPGLTLYLGSEMHRHTDIIATLSQRPAATLAGTRYVLTEFSSRHEKEEIRATLLELRRHGYIPVIAHAERYPAVQADLDFLQDLKALGCRVQLNADSILGEDGFGMKRLCKKMMDRDLVDFVASDAHHPKQRPVTLGRCADLLIRKRGEAYARRLLVSNPEEILSGAAESADD